MAGNTSETGMEEAFNNSATKKKEKQTKYGCVYCTHSINLYMGCSIWIPFVNRTRLFSCNEKDKTMVLKRISKLTVTSVNRILK